jgi:hypothetical protein
VDALTAQLMQQGSALALTTPSSTEATNARMLNDVLGKLATASTDGSAAIAALLLEIATAIAALPFNPPPQPIAQNIQSANYTLVLADAQKQIYHPAADTNNRTWTIPANAAVAFPVGTVVTFVNRVNTITIAITSDTLVFAGVGSTGSRSLAASGVATALKVTDTNWMISGVGLS